LCCGLKHLAQEDQAASLKLDHAKAVARLRRELEAGAREAAAAAERRLAAVREDADLQRKAELNEIEEHKNRHIRDLISHHEQVADARAP
jgi:hypothetical protein